MSTAKPRCEGRAQGIYWSAQCANNASMTHEGKHYCKLHHPPTVQAKNEARNAEMRAKIDREIEARRLANEASKERDRRAALFPELLEALQAAVNCGMVPTTTAKEGGASAYSEQVRVTDQIRAAIAKAKGETK